MIYSEPVTRENVCPDCDCCMVVLDISIFGNDYQGHCATCDIPNYPKACSLAHCIENPYQPISSYMIVPE